MGAALAITVNARQLEHALELAPKRMRDELRTVLLKVGIAHENIVKRNRFGGYRGGIIGPQLPNSRLQRRSGALAQAYKMDPPSATGLEMTSAIRKGMKGSVYAKMQEFGGTVKPKKGKFLTVPLPAALTPSGVLKGRYRIRRSGGSASGYTTDAGDTFLFKSKRGALLIGIKERRAAYSSGVAVGYTEREATSGRGKKRELKAFYVLKRSVTIKPRFGFFDSWDKLERSTLPVLVNRASSRILKEGTGA